MTEEGVGLRTLPGGGAKVERRRLGPRGPGRRRDETLASRVRKGNRTGFTPNHKEKEKRTKKERETLRLRYCIPTRNSYDVTGGSQLLADVGPFLLPITTHRGHSDQRTTQPTPRPLEAHRRELTPTTSPPCTYGRHRRCVVHRTLTNILPTSCSTC